MSGFGLRAWKPFAKLGGFACALALVIGGSQSSVEAEEPYRADPMAAARALAASLAERGRLSGAVEIRASTDTSSNGTAILDLERDVCVVSINPELLPRSPYRNGLGFRFFVYHELSHCELYRRPGGLFRFPELDEPEARLLDDLVLFDTLDDPEERVNVFTLAHELYADLRAAALLIEEGVPPRALEFMVRVRADATMDRVHDSSEILARIAAGAVVFPREALEARVRLMTGESVLAKAITPMFKGSDWQRFELWNALVNRARSLHGRMAANVPWWNDDVWTRPAADRAQATYPLLAWALTEEPRVLAGETREVFVERWRASMYAGEDPRVIADRVAMRLEERMAASHIEAVARARR